MSPVSLPMWLFALLLALALVAACEWMLLPAVRWYFRRKTRRVIDDVSVRLNIDIPQFKLTQRRALIERLLSDPKVLAAVDEQARAQTMDRHQVFKRVRTYAREIVPAFNAYVYFRYGYVLAKTFAQMIYRVRLGHSDGEAMAAINPRSTVVFVMNHRSNMDYVLVSFLAAERVALSYAVGEWARIWPLQALVRAMGAYFVRRNSGDPLYRTVLQRYVQMATDAGVPQALYPEGGLSTDGHLLPPRMGLFDYMLKNFDPDGERDLVFIPVGINYDRVLEDRSLLRRADAAPAPGGVWRSLRITLAYVGKQLLFSLQGRRYRYGYACVNFGKPQSMREHVRSTGIDFRALADEERRLRVSEVGERLMAQIGRIVPVLPVPLVASVLLRGPRAGMAELDIKSAVHLAMERIEAAGGHVYIPRADRNYAIDVGIRMLTLRRLVILQDPDGLYRVNPEEVRLVSYYANSIAHWLGVPASAPA